MKGTLNCYPVEHFILLEIISSQPLDDVVHTKVDDSDDDEGIECASQRQSCVCGVVNWSVVSLVIIMSSVNFSPQDIFRLSKESSASRAKVPHRPEPPHFLPRLHSSSMRSF